MAPQNVSARHQKNRHAQKRILSSPSPDDQSRSPEQLGASPRRLSQGIVPRGHNLWQLVSDLRGGGSGGGMIVVNGRERWREGKEHLEKWLMNWTKKSSQLMTEISCLVQFCCQSSVFTSLLSSDVFSFCSLVARLSCSSV